MQNRQCRAFTVSGVFLPGTSEGCVGGSLPPGLVRKWQEESIQIPFKVLYEGYEHFCTTGRHKAMGRTKVLRDYASTSLEKDLRHKMPSTTLMGFFPIDQGNLLICAWFFPYACAVYKIHLHRPHMRSFPILWFLPPRGIQVFTNACCIIFYIFSPPKGQRPSEGRTSSRTLRIQGLRNYTNVEWKVVKCFYYILILNIN